MQSRIVVEPAQRDAALARIRQLARITHRSLVPLPSIHVDNDGAIVVESGPIPGVRFDELVGYGTPCPLELARPLIADLLGGLAALHRAGFVHGALHPAAMWISNSRARLDHPDLARVARPDAPDLVVPGSLHAGLAPELVTDDAPFTPATDVYMFAAAAIHVLAGRAIYPREEDLVVRIASQPPDLAILDQLDDPVVASALRRALARDPAARPANADALLAALGEIPALDAVEAGFLATLRATPGDAATRTVYADWLEQRGDPRAAYLRDEAAPAPPREAGWRSIVARAPITACEAQTTLAVACPLHWDALAPTERPRVRHCGACARDVYYVTTLAEVRRRADAHQCVALDPMIDAERATPSPERFIRVGMVARQPPVAPPTPPPPPKPSLARRVLGWFRGRSE